MITIQDPIHGAIDLTPAEIDLVDARPLQRLRRIKQLGFAEYAFPSATHTRYVHSLGAMAMATRMINQILPALPIATQHYPRVRQWVRLAALFHDLGHEPLSHVCEKVMPKVGDLALGSWGPTEDRQATHEDYTVKLLLHSELAERITHNFGSLDISASHLAALIKGHPPPDEPDAFVVDGCNLLNLLHSIVSGEIDADRMDYLRRDAYTCGVSYGHFDHDWLIRNLTAVNDRGNWVLALRHKAIWAFENFLLARYHMFLSVYFHHTSICFDQLLKRFFDHHAYTLPSTIDDYLATDDVQLWSVMREADNEWARYVLERRPYTLLIEMHRSARRDDAGEMRTLLNNLRKQEVDFFCTESRGILSKYQHAWTRKEAIPLRVLEPELNRVHTIDNYTRLYERFDDAAGISRIYCRREHAEAARAVLTPRVR